MSLMKRRSAMSNPAGESTKTKKAKQASCTVKQNDDSWRELGTLERHSSLLQSGHRSDCTFLVGAHTDKNKAAEFNCHKFILCNNSQVFEAMFYGSLAEQGVVKVEDIDPKLFHKMLEFMYTDSVDLECVETALGVYHAAHKYLVPSLSSKCQHFIKKSLGAPDVCKTLEFSRLISNKDLEDFSLQKLREDTEDILAADSFIDADSTTLMTLLELNEVGFTSEVALVNGFLRWAKPRTTKQSSLRQVLEPFLHLIRFRTMTSKDFAELVCNTELLMEEEKYSIFFCLASETGKMPSGFSNETKSREFYGKREDIKLLLTPCHEINPRSFIINVYPDIAVPNIFLHGVQLKSLSESDYDEDVKVEYYNSVGTITASTIFKGNVRANKDIDVYFNKPYPALDLLDHLSYSFPHVCVTYMSSFAPSSSYELARTRYSTNFGTDLRVSSASGLSAVSALHLLKI